MPDTTYTPAQIAQITERVWRFNPDATVEVEGGRVRIIPSNDSGDEDPYSAVDFAS